MISKEERRKRLIEDFRKIARAQGKDENEAIIFASSIPDETLDELEKMGYSAERKVRIDMKNNNLETRSE